MIYSQRGIVSYSRLAKTETVGSCTQQRLDGASALAILSHVAYELGGAMIGQTVQLDNQSYPQMENDYLTTVCEQESLTELRSNTGPRDLNKQSLESKNQTPCHTNLGGRRVILESRLHPSILIDKGRDDRHVRPIGRGNKK